MVGELEDALTQPNDLDVTWGFGLDDFLREHKHKVTIASNANDGISMTICSSKGSAADIFAPVGHDR